MVTGLSVMEKACKSCIYNKDSPNDLSKLENDVRDKYVGFNGYRICHSDENKIACCRGFWNRYKNEFAMGQIAQRLGLVKYVKEEG